MKGYVACAGSISSGTYQWWENWPGDKGKIGQHFQVCLRPSCVRWVCFLGNYTEFHEIRTEYQRKIILIHFLLYYLFWLLPNYMCTNLLAHWSLPPRSLSPKWSLPDFLLPPISLLLPPTQYQVLFYPTCSLISWSLLPTLFLSNFLPDHLLPGRTKFEGRIATVDNF